MSFKKNVEPKHSAKYLETYCRSSICFFKILNDESFSWTFSYSFWFCVLKNRIFSHKIKKVEIFETKKNLENWKFIFKLTENHENLQNRLNRIIVVALSLENFQNRSCVKTQLVFDRLFLLFQHFNFMFKRCVESVVWEL